MNTNPQLEAISPLKKPDEATRSVPSAEATQPLTPVTDTQQPLPSEEMQPLTSVEAVAPVETPDPFVSAEDPPSVPQAENIQTLAHDENTNNEDTAPTEKIHSLVPTERIQAAPLITEDSQPSVPDEDKIAPTEKIHPLVSAELLRTAILNADIQPSVPDEDEDELAPTEKIHSLVSAELLHAATLDTDTQPLAPNEDEDEDTAFTEKIHPLVSAELLRAAMLNEDMQPLASRDPAVLVETTHPNEDMQPLASRDPAVLVETTHPLVSVKSVVAAEATHPLVSGGNSQSVQTLTSLWLRTQSVLERMPLGAVAVIVGLVVFIVQGYRLSAAPDIFSDEGVYLLVGANMAKGLGLDLNGTPFLWHAPLYMLIEAGYIKLAGLANADLLTILFSVRYLNIFFSAVTAMLLLFIGSKLHSKKAGLITVGLFLMDPYVQRINRRNMLETLAMLFVLAGLYLFFTEQPRLKWSRRLGAGIVFGLALLAKEPMLLELLTLLLYVLLFRRSQLHDALWVIAIAITTYLPYPLWAIATGQGHNYLAFKLFGLQRIQNFLTGAGHVAAYHASNVNFIDTEKNVSFLSTILLKLTQYGTSYLLIGFTALCLIFLALRFRQNKTASYLISWGTFSLVFGLILGNISDQYFYYLIVPSTLIVGYSLTLLLETVLHPATQKSTSPVKRTKLRTMLKVALTRSLPGAQKSSHGGAVALLSLPLERKGRATSGQNTPPLKRRLVVSLDPSIYRIIWRPIFALFILMFIYNSYSWITTYVKSSDTIYINTVKYVETHLPPGTTIEASDDVAVYFLSPEYNIRLDRDPTTITDLHAHYFIMSSKDAWGEYDGMTSALYNWVELHSHPLMQGYDLSFWQIGLYQLTTG